MDGLKIIPQVFFDLIARVVPGVVFILIFLKSKESTWEDFLKAIFGESSFENAISITSLLMLLGGGYIVGHLIATVAKLIQRLGEGIHNCWHTLLPKDSQESQESQEFKESKKSKKSQESKDPKGPKGPKGPKVPITT